MSDERDEKLKAYEQLCTSYRAIDDFRAKLLGFLPLASGTGIFLLVKNLGSEGKGSLTPIGVFGFLITMGLFSYEIYGIRKCCALIEAGKQIEDSMAVGGLGQFRQRPQNFTRVINEPFAAGIIYPTVLAAWAFLALVFVSRPVAVGIAILVFLTGFVVTLKYDAWLQDRCEKAKKKREAEAGLYQAKLHSDANLRDSIGRADNEPHSSGQDRKSQV